MMLKEFIDTDGNEINKDKIYFDIKNNVEQIHILEIDGIWYAQPDGLSKEKLIDVARNLKLKGSDANVS